MDIDIDAVVRGLEEGVGLVPSALIAVVLLAGPTTVWLLYRFVVQPRTSRYRHGEAGGAMWVCAACRSVNELRTARCYRCDRTPDEAQLHVIDPDVGIPLPIGLPAASSRTGVPVGPGPAPDRTSVPVGPGRPRPARPRRAVVAGRGVAGPDPDDAPAA